jgi:putative glutathione S-transferase
MLNTTFDAWAKHPDITFYPEKLRVPIDALNEWIYNDINNGVYRAGFATSQEAYERAVHDVFHALDRVEQILREQKSKPGAEGKGPWLLGDVFTEADIRLFTTILRFDCVYHGHFKTNLKTIEFGYPHLRQWAARLYHIPGIKETIHMDHIKRHYYMSHVNINPTRIVPVGNGPDWTKYLEKW